jgi:hypothetical protein
MARTEKPSQAKQSPKDQKAAEAFVQACMSAVCARTDHRAPGDEDK